MGSATDAVDAFLRGLHRLLADYRETARNRDPGRDRTVAYGNVRFQVWEGEKGTSIAVIYETPGGSTDQISVEFDRDTRAFSLPSPENEAELSASNFTRALKELKKHLDAIPDKRMERLRTFIRSWYQDEHRSRLDIFNALNQLQKEEFRGGRITHEELAKASRYVVEIDRQAKGEGRGTRGEG